MTISNRITAADQRLLSRMTAADMQALDRAIAGFGRGASHGVLWFAVAIALGARRDKWTRRAALRGLASMAVASPAVNVLAKRLVRHLAAGRVAGGRPGAAVPRWRGDGDEAGAQDRQAAKEAAGLPAATGRLTGGGLPMTRISPNWR